MHFSSTSRNISLDVNSDGGLYLCCECDTGILDNHGEKIWTPNSFPLHDYFHVAVDQPKIRYGKGGGYAITDSNHFDRYDASLVGSSILKAKVRAGSGSWQYASTCLDFFFTNKLGFLTCDKPSQYLCASVAMIQVSQTFNDNTGHWEVPLSGLCIGLDGQLHASSIDLSLHYVNDNGLWKKKKNGHFGDSAKDCGFDSYGHFNCSLSAHGQWGYPIDYDLYQDVHNDDGVLTIQDPAGFWDSRGPFFRILEDIPVLGYAVAVADFARGDPDEAQRAVAECTLSTIAAVCCFFATTLLGPVGACLAAAAINTGALLAKEGMAANMGEPSFFTKSVGAAITGFFFSEFLVIAGVGLDGLVGSYMDMLEEEFVASAIDGMVVDVGTWGGKKALKTLTKKEFEFIMQTVLDAVTDGASLEEAQQQVDTKIEEWFEETQVPEFKKKISTKMTSLGYTWDDQTIIDDIYKAAVTADYEDDKRLENVIVTTCNSIVPDFSWALDSTISQTIVADGYELTNDLISEIHKQVNQYVYREHADLVKRITYLLGGMGLGDPSKIRSIRLSITRIKYTYSTDLVNRIEGKLSSSDYSSRSRLDSAMKTIFAGLPSSDRNSLDGEVDDAIYRAGFFRYDGDVENIENDLMDNEFVYDYISNLRTQLIKLAHEYCDYDHHIMPSAPKAPPAEAE